MDGSRFTNREGEWSSRNQTKDRKCIGKQQWAGSVLP